MNLYRSALKAWAKIGIAPGYLYQVVDKSHDNSGNIKQAKVVGGNIVNCDLRDHVQKQIYFFGCYEPIENYLLSQLVKEDSIVLDVGANIGFYSLTLSNAIKSGQVYSFEAVPDTYKKLSTNIENSSKNDQVTAFNLGAWNKKEEVTFSLPDSDNIGAFTAGSVSGESTRTCQATMTTLDSFVEENKLSKVDFIKMDIEGAELNALKGAHELLEKFKPTILLEVCRETCERFEYTVNDLWDLLSQYGYRAFKIGYTPNDSYEIKDFSQINQSNVILTISDLSQYIKDWNYKEIKAYYAQALNLFD
jgi:FkbM family methyltransferase